MATTTKLSFRARNLDANKAMCVYFASELPDLSECAPIARAVAQMPTGMEKEEEMESHLQDAILAQQASTSGIRVDNHVIPTPKVFPVESTRYNETYPLQAPPPKNQFIKVQAWLALDKEEPDYDMDSEDEAWLSERPHIEPRALERIFDTLEAQSSDNNICLPTTARSVLTAFEEVIVDDVYDYWLAKREKATISRTFHLGVGGLIPRVRTECRKDAQGAVNPYVAFRRRAEKMQTRKNRKNDEDSYEKVLKLGHDLRKTVTLFDMVKRREKTKLALIDLDSDILAHRMGLADFGSSVYNQFLSRIRNDTVKQSIVNGISKYDADDSTPKKKQKRRKIRPSTTSVDREVPSKAWLKKNAEVWNRPPSVFNPIGMSPVVEVERSAQAASDANQDGRYTFRRRRGCIYRAPLNVHSNDVPVSSIKEQIPLVRHLYHTFLPGLDGTIRSYGMARRRVGRGGRVIIDRIVDAQMPRVPKVYDPFNDEFMEDHSVNFRARVNPSPEENYGYQRKTWENESDEERERQWLAYSNDPSSNQPTKHPPDQSPFRKDEAAILSGNGLAGRVDQPTSIPAKVCGAVAVSDEWREESGSPSESNSSSEWAPPSLGARLAAFAMLSSEEEARTGDHPIARQPPIKECVCYFDKRLNVMVGQLQTQGFRSVVGATDIECGNPFLLAPPPVGS